MKAWKQFEITVADIYERLGYKVLQDVDRNGKQVDIECSKTIPGIGLVTFMVDCKHTEMRTAITSQKIADFISDYQSLKISCGYQKAVMVSPMPFTRQAKARIGPHADIELRTIGELKRDLINAEPYLLKLKSEFLDYQEAINYINLRAVSNAGASESKEGPAEKLINDWLTDSTSQHMWLLGDFGSGKTTSLRHQFLSVLDGESHPPPCRIPLFLQLRNYANCKTGDEIIERFLAHEIGHPMPLRTFRELFHGGEIVLFCDGFDEMGEASDANVRRKNFLMLASLAGGRSKTIVSCRPAYFIDATEFSAILTTFAIGVEVIGREVKGDRVNREAATLLTSSILKKLDPKDEQLDHERLVSQYRSSQVIELKLLSQQQIKEFLGKHDDSIRRQSGGNLNAEKLQNIIAEVYDLEDLSSRPILLKLIVETLPWLYEQTKKGYRIVRGRQDFVLNAITPSLLYHAYTERELARELSKGISREIIDSANKRRLVQALAYRMHKAQKLEVSRESFIQLLESFYPAVDRLKLEQIDTEFRSCSFLTRDDAGNIRFVHKSFLEYFAADEIVSKMIAPNGLAEELSDDFFSEEICYFVGDLIAVFASSLIGDLHEARTSSAASGVCKVNSINVLNAGRQVVRHAAGVPCGRIIYKKIESDQIVFSESKVDRLNIYKSKLDKLELVKSHASLIDISASAVHSMLISAASLVEVLSFRGQSPGVITADLSEIQQFRASAGTLTADFRSAKVNMNAESIRSFKEFRAQSSVLIFAQDVELSCPCSIRNCIIIGLSLHKVAPTVSIQNSILVGCFDSSKNPSIKTVDCRGFVFADRLGKVSGEWRRNSLIAYGPKGWFDLLFSKLDKKIAEFEQNVVLPKRKKLEGLESLREAQLKDPGSHKKLKRTTKAICDVFNELDLLLATFRNIKYEYALNLKEGERLALGLMRHLGHLKVMSHLEAFDLVKRVGSGLAFKPSQTSG